MRFYDNDKLPGHLSRAYRLDAYYDEMNAAMEVTMEENDALWVKLHRAEQKKSTWEWTRDNANENIRSAEAEVLSLRLELGKLLNKRSINPSGK